MILEQIKQLRDSGSFRDPSGFIFYQNNEVYRLISNQYYKEYQEIKSLGLFEELVDKEYIVPFKEIEEGGNPEEHSLVIKPKLIPFISYPYEWSFEQLKDAALLTLEIQKVALKYGVHLKDASSYNIQFIGCKPIFIDTLSFETVKGASFWKAYRQFCQHFLAPLTIFSYLDPSLKSLFIEHLDGIPLNLATKLLPKKAYFSLARFIHLYVHSRFNEKLSNQPINKNVKNKTQNTTSNSVLGLIESLESSIKSLKLRVHKSIWKNYYQGDSYSTDSFKEKQEILETFLGSISTERLVDFGSNNGFFTEVAAKYAKNCIAADFDLLCINDMYIRLKDQKNSNILPLHVNLANPSPGIGWANTERKSWLERCVCDTAVALALIHHLIVTAAIPLDSLVEMFASICKHLIIEYVPPSDPKFQQISQTNPNNFSFFTEETFKSAFSEHFECVKKCRIGTSNRVLFLLKNKLEV